MIDIVSCTLSADVTVTDKGRFQIGMELFQSTVVRFRKWHGEGLLSQGIEPEHFRTVRKLDESKEWSGSGTVLDEIDTVVVWTQLKYSCPYESKFLTIFLLANMTTIGNQKESFNRLLISVSVPEIWALKSLKSSEEMRKENWAFCVLLTKLWRHK